MKLIAGLGNPGSRYARTGHNIGFMAADAIAGQFNARFSEKKFQSLLCDLGSVGGERLLLLKPQTFMNLSGAAVREAMGFYKIEPACLLVIYDDMDLIPFEIRLRRGGSAGGHKGMSSVISHMGTSDIARLKMGIGHPLYGEAAGHVLRVFSKEEMRDLGESVLLAAEAAVYWAGEGITAAMNRYNGIAKEPKQD